MKKTASVLILSVVLAQLLTGSFAGQAQQARFTKTALLSDKDVAALGAEINGVIAKDTVIEIARSHRVQASSGYSRAAEYIAAKAKEYGLDQVQIERFPADGENPFRPCPSPYYRGRPPRPQGAAGAGRPRVHIDPSGAPSLD